MSLFSGDLEWDSSLQARSHFSLLGLVLFLFTLVFQEHIDAHESAFEAAQSVLVAGLGEERRRELSAHPLDVGQVLEVPFVWLPSACAGEPKCQRDEESHQGAQNGTKRPTAGKSCRPQSNSAITQATAQTSRVSFQPLPNMTSGDRYCRVPTSACRILPAAQNSAVPKSMTRIAVLAGWQ
jgi:hypothetical protein